MTADFRKANAAVPLGNGKMQVAGSRVCRKRKPQFIEFVRALCYDDFRIKEKGRGRVFCSIEKR